MNSLLINLLFDSLIETNYCFVEKIAEYIYSIDIKDDRDLRIMVINHCIALKEQEKIEQMEEILSNYDWSATALDFDLALAVLRNKEEEIYSLLDDIIKIEEIGASELLEWPLFGQLRNTEKFQKYLKDKFPDISEHSLEYSDSSKISFDPESHY